MRANPFDPDDGLLEIDRHNQPVCVALHVEDDALGSDDAGGLRGSCFAEQLGDVGLLGQTKFSVCRRLTLSTLMCGADA
jgi:hypothetical protein